MRITNNEIDVFKKSIFSVDENAKIYLFGSRTDDTKKGGDIDLLIISTSLQQRHSRKIKQNIFDELEEQKIDILIKKDFYDSFVAYIQDQCIEL